MAGQSKKAASFCGTVLSAVPLSAHVRRTGPNQIRRRTPRSTAAPAAMTSAPGVLPGPAPISAGIYPPGRILGSSELES
ncbi:hypothetical protein PF011_g7842 [Phytophthora fragariae]|uniref:Uncharacterized protein n=1 Tax=Phytophthora fragariae TaxID=53985 RepID=A0A6A3L5K6_9STRA|nr:hypothetical protein PF011_g7842 [Phytophthora fragariae]